MSQAVETQARHLVDLRRRKDSTAQAADRAKKAYDAAEQAFWDRLYEDPNFGKTKTIVLELGEGYGDVQFQRRETITATILDPEEAAAALEDEHVDGAVAGYKVIRKKVANQEVRDRLKAGRPLPKGLDHHAKRYIAISMKGDS